MSRSLPALGMLCDACGCPASRWIPGAAVLHDDGRACLFTADQPKGPLPMHEEGRQFATLRALKRRLREIETHTGAVFLAQLDEGDSKAVALPDGTRLGRISKASGKRTAHVEDEREFLEWVKTNHPSEIEENVRPAYRDRVLNSAKTHGEAVDETSGEIIPGVALRTGDPYLSYRGEPDSDALIAAHWRELIPAALMLEAGE